MDEGRTYSWFALALAFSMGRHVRLGAESPVRWLPREICQYLLITFLPRWGFLVLDGCDTLVWVLEAYNGRILGKLQDDAPSRNTCPQGIAVGGGWIWVSEMGPSDIWRRSLDGTKEERLEYSEIMSGLCWDEKRQCLWACKTWREEIAALDGNGCQLSCYPMLKSLPHEPTEVILSPNEMVIRSAQIKGLMIWDANRGPLRVLQLASVPHGIAIDPRSRRIVVTCLDGIQILGWNCGKQLLDLIPIDGAMGVAIDPKDGAFFAVCNYNGNCIQALNWNGSERWLTHLPEETRPTHICSVNLNQLKI